jgi:GT2 family glycosyltransferase
MPTQMSAGGDRYYYSQFEVQMIAGKDLKWEKLAASAALTTKKPILGDITLIIPTLGRPILESCLAKIVLGSYWPETLIIVHQGDDDIVKEWMSQVQKTGIHVVYIHSTERGKPAAINLAFAQTQTRFVCMTDDDCFVQPDWLLAMHRSLLTNPDWIITGRVEPAGNETVAVVQLKDAVVYSRPRLKFDLFVGGNMGAAMDVIRRVGPFDEDPLLRNAAEDAEWGYRALRKGIPIAYAPQVAVAHFGWRAESENLERLKNYAHGHGSFYGKYLRKGDLFILLRAVSHFLRAGRRWLIGRLSSNLDQARMGRAYCLGLIPGMIAGYRSPFQAGR